ncbi:NADH-quinone oxidoreductase subunit NuoK [Microvenator marinus]|jgi:NADH-quinone oxidoreductase subunit K|uniref:NADH-quinone oxidoreductase subunit K n=1 Tax=Microvenator marinus TaxID=2600177 RepID=A0A5B8XQK5_9DELT|nr:NADH-quinone oxidoreductase subunit NuoK [Microvenator marinus]QED25679.1 NADH-quinone oxidoreductase subunit NuoK [Microvenator marinus]
MEITLTHYLLVGAITFCIGVYGVLVKRNAITLFMCVELMLNSVNLTFIAFSKYRVDLDGHVFAFFIMAVAAAEAAVGLALILHIFRHYRSLDVDRASELRL